MALDFKQSQIYPPGTFMASWRLTLAVALTFELNMRRKTSNLTFWIVLERVLDTGVGTKTFSRFSWFSRFRIFSIFGFRRFPVFAFFSILRFRFLFYENGKTTKTFSRKRFPFSFWFSFSFRLNFAVFLRKIEAIIS